METILELLKSCIRKFSVVTSSDLVDDAGQPGRLLFERDGVVHVLVAEVLNGRGQVTEED